MNNFEFIYYNSQLYISDFCITNYCDVIEWLQFMSILSKLFALFAAYIRKCDWGCYRKYCRNTRSIVTQDDYMFCCRCKQFTRNLRNLRVIASNHCNAAI